MKKSIFNLGKALSKAEQKSINGGIGGCYGLYFCQFDCAEGDRCAVPNGSGGANFGTIQNGLCCL